MIKDITDKKAASQNNAFKLPETIHDDGVLVGWSLEDQNKPMPIGFCYDTHKKKSAIEYLDPILMEREGHLITIAPTGAGKGIGCVIPSLLRYPGPVIVIDPKGENYAVTARRRKELGQDVVLLDPMGITGAVPDKLNPLDLIDPESPVAVDDIAALVSELWGGTYDSRDKFWVSRASQLLICAVLHVLCDYPKKKHTLHQVRFLVNQWMSGLGQTSGQVESSGGSQESSSYDRLKHSRHPEVVRIASMLLNPANETLGGILAFCQDALSVFRGPLLEEATRETTFDLNGITRGDKISVYLVLPPHMLESHGKLLKMWVSVLMRCMTRRRGAAEMDTLFILDEAAQLGTFPQLRQAITLLRGYGVRTWSFWQDTSQLKMLYPNDWETMINNCRVFQAFGANNYPAAQQVASMTGFHNPSKILDLEYDEMILLIAGDEAIISQRPNYLTDPVFKGMFDSNPLRGKMAESFPERTLPQKMYIRPRNEELAKMKQEDSGLLDELLALWDD